MCLDLDNANLFSFAGPSSAAACAQESQHTPAQVPVVPAAGCAEDSLPGRAGLQTNCSTAGIRSDRSVGNASCWSTVTQVLNAGPVLLTELSAAPVTRRVTGSSIALHILLGSQVIVL